jgi:hypothetical protein
MEYWKE